MKSMAMARGSSTLRLLAAAVFVIAAVAFCFVEWPGGTTPGTADSSLLVTGSSGPSADAPALSELANHEEEGPGDGEATREVAVPPPPLLTWRIVAGVARRADTGAPTKVRLSAHLADGTPVSSSSSESFVGFTGRVDERATSLTFTPNSTDLEEVEVPIPPNDAVTALDVVLPVARGLIRARVVDPRGDGVKGIVVAAGGRARRTTDARGNVMFRPLRDGFYTLVLRDVPFSTTAGPGGRVSNGLVTSNTTKTVEVKKRTQSEPVVFTVPRGSTLRGVIVEQGSQSPIAAVDVFLTRPGAQAHRAERSNEDGFFEFPRLVPGSYRLSATADDGEHGRLVMDLPPLVDGETRTVELALATGVGALSGRTVDEEGEPVPFAAIECSRGADAGRETLTARTDSHGRFKVKSLPTGTWTIGPSASYCQTHNWVERYVETVLVSAGQEADVNLTLRPGSFLVGRVVSSSNRKDIVVRVHLDEDTTIERSLGQRGRFALGGVLPGTYLVEAVDPAFMSAGPLASQMVYVASGEESTVRLEVP